MPKTDARPPEFGTREWPRHVLGRLFDEKMEAGGVPFEGAVFKPEELVSAGALATLRHMAGEIESWIPDLNTNEYFAGKSEGYETVVAIINAHIKRMEADR